VQRQFKLNYAYMDNKHMFITPSETQCVCPLCLLSSTSKTISCVQLEGAINICMSDLSVHVMELTIIEY